MVVIEDAAGPSWTSEIGPRLLSLVPVESLVPDEQAVWRPFIREAIRFVFFAAL